MPSVYQFRQAALSFFLSWADARLKTLFRPIAGARSLKPVQVHDPGTRFVGHAGVTSRFCLPVGHVRTGENMGRPAPTRAHLRKPLTTQHVPGAKPVSRQPSCRQSIRLLPLTASASDLRAAIVPDPARHHASFSGLRPKPVTHHKMPRPRARPPRQDLQPPRSGAIDSTPRSAPYAQHWFAGGSHEESLSIGCGSP